jgi:hypothetical protein
VAWLTHVAASDLVTLGAEFGTLRGLGVRVYRLGTGKSARCRAEFQRMWPERELALDFDPLPPLAVMWSMELEVLQRGLGTGPGGDK